MVSDRIQELTEANFDRSLEAAGLPVLVDFWAEWCGPCKRLGPIVDALATELSGRLTVAKLNVDDNPGIAGRFGIRGIPTLLLFKNGEIVESVVGLVGKDELKRTIEPHLSPVVTH
jgi:thioredoxin 1